MIRRAFLRAAWAAGVTLRIGLTLPAIECEPIDMRDVPMREALYRIPIDYMRPDQWG